MHPIICALGPFRLYSYGLMLAIAFLVALFLIKRQAEKEKAIPERVINLCLLIFISGIIGARLFYILENLSYYLKNPAEILMLSRGGLSWFGGLILGLFSGIFYLRKKKMPVDKTFDLLVPFVALAQAIGRIGCLLNGCCFGKPSAFGLYFARHQEVLVPTQIYSSLALILIFLILRFRQERPHRPGEIFYTYLLLYSLKRFLIEFWRQDNPPVVASLTLFQLISVAIFCFSFWQMLRLKRRQK